MISAGILNEIVTLQKRVVTRNSINEQIIDYETLDSPYGEVPAAVKFLKSTKAVIASHLNESTQITVTTRYDDEMLKTRRLKWQGNYYLLNGVPLGDRINDTITYNCTLEDDGITND